ncbi:LysR family transcriptional regulator [Neorhizobium lilium]|uniref:HTH-type transcriptional regulator TtuA n=1 Tax=Neorhizobium lilium TaxID=2503024 RepID=A0A3S3RIN9_9HYPH|nr:LysR family transcriptional regulator [Neorhizobium lilium]RWX79034.1 LysR family transcriptional regulator [Neorhizobium lilium]
MDKSNITLERMRIFVRIAERANLSAVAREFGIGQSTVSRQLRELEEALGVPLLSRTTRRLNLTPEGSAYYAQCLQILRLVDKAGDEARTVSGAPAGMIRISCTGAFGILKVSRLLFEFQDLYPEIHIDLSLSDERIDLVQEGVDLSIRLGPLADSSLKLRLLGASRRLLVASADYLDRNGRPAAPDDLRQHQGIRMANIAGSDMLVLRDGKTKQHIVPFGGRLMVDHGLAAREAVLAGRGIAPAHHWLVDDLLQSGEVEPVLPDYGLDPVPLSMLIVPERAGIARVRLLADFLAERIRAILGPTA